MALSEQKFLAVDSQRKELPLRTCCLSELGMDFLILFWKCLCTKFFFLMTIIHRVIFLHPHIAWCFCMRMQNVVLFCLIGQLLHNPNIHLISLFFRRQSIGRPTLYVYFKLFCPKFCHHRRQRISTPQFSDSPNIYNVRETRYAEDADETPKNCYAEGTFLAHIIFMQVNLFELA